MLTDILEINQAALAEAYDFAIENNTVCLVFGAAGIGKCVTGDTLVFTSDGLTEIKNLVPLQYHCNDKSSSGPLEIEVLSHEKTLTKTSRWYCDGKCKTITIRTGCGFEITGTDKHRIIVATDQGPKWKRLDDINQDDSVAIIRKNLPFGKKTIPSTYAYLIGYFVGDGSFYGQPGSAKGIRYTVGDQDLQEFLTKNSSALFEHFGKFSIYNYEGRAPTIAAFGGVDAEFLEKECGRGAGNKQVPSFILSGDKLVWASFIRGLFDADAGVYSDAIEFCSKSKKLVKTVQTMLTAFGIISCLKEKSVNENIYYRLFLTGEDARRYVKQIGFGYSRKQTAININKCINTNKDTVPISKKLWGRLKNECKPLPRPVHKIIGDYYRNNKRPSRAKLDVLIKTIEGLKQLQHRPYSIDVMLSLQDEAYFWDTISNINQSEDIVFDLVVPDLESFAAGGFVNHNTELAIQRVKNYNLSHYHVNLSVLEPPDLVGLPFTREGKTSYAPPEFLPWLSEESGPPVTLLLDELDKAHQDLQNPLLELLQFHSVNGRKLNLQGIICTGNLPDENAFSRKVSHALTNRCSIYKVKHDFQPWRKWAVEVGLNPLIVSFLQSNQDFLLVKERSGDPTAYCSPSPRSWTYAARDLDKLDYDKFAERYKQEQADELSEVELPEDILKAEIDEKFIGQQFRIIAGRVGVSAALQLKMWLTYYRDLEPVINEILDTGLSQRQLTSDQQIICATSVLSGMKQRFSRMKQSEKPVLADRVFGWMIANMSPAFMLASIKSTLNKDYVSAHGLLDSDNFNQMMDIIHETATI